MNKVSISNRVRVTTIRATTDIFYKPNHQQQIFPAAALRICDHHLHSSGIIPRIYHAHDDPTARIYEHEWFCVSQAVQCYTHSASQLENESNLLHRVVSGTDPCYCDVWVDSDSIGNSSIQFGGLVSIGNDVLAVVRRVFVRMTKTDTNSKESGEKLSSARFSDEEKQRFRDEFGFEALGISENYKACDTKKIQELVPIKRPDLNSDRLKIKIKELESLSTLQGGESPITRVTVDPQHINFGNHADHAFLAETAFHALTVSTKLDRNYVAVQYLSEVLLGDLLESYAHRQDGGGEEMDCIILVATRKITGERNVVLIAQGE